MQAADKFKGIIAPIVSPCDEKDQLDFEKLELNFNRLVKSDVNGLYICGGTGDGERLSISERQEITDLFVNRLRTANKTSIIHVGQTYQRAAVLLAEHAAKAGADAVASIPPAASWGEVVDYYRALAEVGLPVFVYYIPAVTKMTAQLDQLKAILDIDGVVGIKMSDWNLFLLKQVKMAYPEKVVYSGYDELLSLGLLYGADGSIGTWANLFPDMYAKAYKLVNQGQFDKLIQIQDKFTAFLAVGWQYGIIDTFEELMYAKGYANRCFRRPSTWNPGKISREVLEKLLRQMDEIDLMVASL